MVSGLGDSSKKATLESRASSWLPRSQSKVNIFELPSNLKMGSFDTRVRLTDDMAKLDSNVEGMLRRVERVLTEADKDLPILKGSKQVKATASTTKKDSTQSGPEFEEMFFKVTKDASEDLLHDGKSLFMSYDGAYWIYYDKERDNWFIDGKKDDNDELPAVGEGARNDTYIFRGVAEAGGNDKPPKAWEANFDLYSKNSQAIVQVEEGTVEELPLAVEDDGERDFKVQTSSWVSVDTYLQGFSWDEFKCPSDRAVDDLCMYLVKKANEADENFKNVTVQYNEAKAKNTASSNRDTHLHATRELIDILSPGVVSEVGDDGSGDFVFTATVTTVLVVVPKGGEEDFDTFYQGEPAEKVIPRSAKVLACGPDKDGNLLYRVLIFRSTLEAFKKSCRENKYITRDYAFSKQGYDQIIAAREKLAAELIRKHRQLVHQGVVEYSNLMTIWTHLKVMRLAVEAQLRFGQKELVSCLFAPDPNRLKQCRDGLASILGSKQDTRMIDAGDEGDEYFPYVSLGLSPLSTSKAA